MNNLHDFGLYPSHNFIFLRPLLGIL